MHASGCSSPTGNCFEAGCVVVDTELTTRRFWLTRVSGPCSPHRYSEFFAPRVSTDFGTSGQIGISSNSQQFGIVRANPVQLNFGVLVGLTLYFLEVPLCFFYHNTQV